jgi:hypothetical protein
MITATINTDYLRERLRERRDDYYTGQLCANCSVQLTEADVQAEECTNCHSGITVDDESADEDCFDDGYGDG